MTRHARNATASAVYTYHEKRKDAGTSGYGQKKMRLAKDSVKDFDCCCLTLQPCLNPVVTSDGYLFDKAAILEYILKKKQDYKKHFKAWEKDQERLKAKDREEAEAAEKKRESQFQKREDGIVSGRASAFSSGDAAAKSISNMSGGRDKELPSYWIPSLTPASSQTAVPKPSPVVCCPMSGKPIKVKDLITVNFTPAPAEGDDVKKGFVAKERRYVCAVTRDVLNNSTPCAVLRPTGDVVTVECFEKLIKKDMLHPISGEKLEEADIIPLRMGGTGFASANEKLEAAQNRPALQV